MQNQDQNTFILEDLPPFISLIERKYNENPANRSATIRVMREHIKKFKEAAKKIDIKKDELDKHHLAILVSVEGNTFECAQFAMIERNDFKDLGKLDDDKLKDLHRKALDRLDLLKDEELILLYKSAEHMSINLLEDEQGALECFSYTRSLNNYDAHSIFRDNTNNILKNAALLCTFSKGNAGFRQGHLTPYKQPLIEHFHKNLQADVAKKLITNDDKLCTDVCIAIFNEIFNIRENQHKDDGYNTRKNGFKEAFKGLELDDKIIESAYNNLERLKKDKRGADLTIKDLQVTRADAFWALISYLPKAIYSLLFGVEVELSTRALKNNVKSFVQIIEKKAESKLLLSV
jgi:hypothetical protein